ncbi:MAG: hypothetical protein ACTHJ4_01940 [Candidatus Nucleicultricaceae bacterium]
MKKFTMIFLKGLLVLGAVQCPLYASYRPCELTDEEKIEAYGINNTREFQSFIGKIKLKKAVKLKNKTDKEARVTATLGKNDGRTMTLRFRLKPETSVTTEPPEDWYLKNMEVETGQHLSLSRRRKGEGERKIIVGEKPVIPFPRPLGDFNFIPRFLMREFKESEKDYHDSSRPVPANLTARFKREYDDNLAYLLYAACPGEKVKPLDFFKQRQEMYEKNRLEKVFSHLADAPDRVPLKIPQKIHKVWLTNPDDPKELPEDYIAWAKRTVEACPISEGWEPYLWIQENELLPQTIKEIEKFGVKVKLIGKLKASIEESKILLDAIRAKKFGVASDLARAIAVREEGGIYTDTDYALRQSAIVLCRAYNFFAGLEPMSSFVGNACYGASKNHPIINKYIELMVRNYTSSLVPEYIKKIPDHDGFKTILLTGPSVLGFAIYHAANKDSNVDIVFPPKMLYPTPVDDYPQKEVVKDGDPLSDESLGEHFWETAWNRLVFGSNG